MSSCFSRCLRVPIAIRAFYESYLWILQTLSLRHPDLHPGLLESFDAVYYSQQVPISAESLTILGLVFDRLIFPGVYLPTSSFDEEALKREIKRITSLGIPLSIEDVQMLNCMEFSFH